ncbi:MAG: M15 family metallopeptidase [Selenomonadaceae bacterium]|nr:M15 family metallopeptidase [Selenomonadaceae bacterium]
MKTTLQKIAGIFLIAVTLTFGQIAKAADPADASGFVVLSDVCPDIIQEIRYYSTYNFVGDRIRGYEEPIALMTKEAAAALKAVSDELKAKGYRLKIYDAYRPQMAVDNFKSWAEDLNDRRMQPYFYPEVNKNRLFVEGYIDARSGHSRGSTVDLTILDMRTGKEVDMGGTFDYFGKRSHPDFVGDLTQKQKDNRLILRNAMINNGFKPLDTEWWHFTLKNEPYPNTYFTFPVARASIEKGKR